MNIRIEYVDESGARVARLELPVRGQAATQTFQLRAEQLPEVIEKLGKMQTDLTAHTSKKK